MSVLVLFVYLRVVVFQVVVSDQLPKLSVGVYVVVVHAGQRNGGWCRVFPSAHENGATKLADMTVKPIPDGYTSLTPFLCIDGASAAIDFYVSVFGAKLVDRMDGPDGTVAHAELDFGNGRLQLGAPA